MKKTFKHAIAFALLVSFAVLALGSMGSSPGSGSSDPRCTLCGGSGKCPTCAGTGAVIEASGIRKVCPACYGLKTCGRCNGTGRR